MSTFKVEVVKLPSFIKHPNADSLNIVQIFSYPVIFSMKEGFNEGDLVAYIPVDAVAPMTPQWAFLGDSERSHRIKSKKLRGVFSMGLLTRAPEGAKVGDDVAAQLGFTKFEQPEPTTMGGENERDPGFIPCYTDIEGYRRYAHLLTDGEPVVIAEKLHGCFQSTARITMEDGTNKPISKIKPGDVVLGVRDQQVVPSLVRQIFDNGKTQDWLKITGPRRKSGRGSNFYSFKCTPEHPIFCVNRNQYLPAKDLTTTDTLLLHRLDIDLSPTQEQVLLGILLGDGYLHVAGSEMSASVSWSHSETQQGYLNWIRGALVGILRPGVETYTSGYGSQMTKNGTVFSHTILEKFKEFYTADNLKKIKKVPNWIAEKLTPIALAFWYMDDGSLSHDKDQEDRANFAVCDFSREDCQLLLTALKKYDIEGVYYQSSAPASNGTNGTEVLHSRIRLNAIDAEKLFLLIAPYVPTSMQYKLPERYRGHQGWIPQGTSNCFKPWLVEQGITSIEKITPHSKKYNLETETHNFFAHAVLVHNCNSRYVYHSKTERLWAGSRTCIKKYDETNLWWKAAKAFGLDEKLKKAPDKVLYGEIFGTVQDLKYDAKKGELLLRFFDVYDIATGQYMNWQDAKKIIEDIGLIAAPLLHDGPWSKDLLPMAEGKSTIANNVREGFVVRPQKERFSEEVGRVILKMVGEGYLLRKGDTTEYH